LRGKPRDRGQAVIGSGLISARERRRDAVP